MIIYTVCSRRLLLSSSGYLYAPAAPEGAET